MSLSLFVLRLWFFASYGLIFTGSFLAYQSQVDELTLVIILSGVLIMTVSAGFLAVVEVIERLQPKNEQKTSDEVFEDTAHS